MKPLPLDRQLCESLNSSVAHSARRHLTPRLQLTAGESSQEEPLLGTKLLLTATRYDHRQAL